MEPFPTKKLFRPDVSSVWYTVSPDAGEEIASLYSCVILGGSKPLVVEEISKAADSSGVSVLIPLERSLKRK